MTTIAALIADDEVVFCGWSLRRGGSLFGLGASQCYFALRRDATLSWFDGVEPVELGELRYVRCLDLSSRTTIKRERPESDTDYTFRIATASAAPLRLDPGSKEAFDKWQQGLSVAVTPIVIPTLADVGRKASAGTPSKRVMPV